MIFYNDLCHTTDLDTNPWCLNNLYAIGEGSQLIALPVEVFELMRKRWMYLPVSEDSHNNVLDRHEKDVSIEYWDYIPPDYANNVEMLFPDSASAGYKPEGLYFGGNNLIFNPTIEVGVETDGTPYQMGSFALPIGSNKEYLSLALYMQAKRWVFIKIDGDVKQLNIYGGMRGFMPILDENVEMMFSGNNDAKGKTVMQFITPRQSVSYEYWKVSNSITSTGEEFKELMSYIAFGACINSYPRDIEISI